MPIRRAKNFTYRPKGLSDSQDGSNTFAGAMAILQNLVPSPTTASLFVPRPAAVPLTAFDSFNTPGVISAMLVLGTRVYGMIGSARFAGHDEPFVYDLLAEAFITVAGVTAANTPATVSPNGDWIPPTIVAVTNARIIVTHPGFPGGAGPYFGWFDISSFVAGAILGNTTMGSTLVQSIQNPTGTSAPILSGVEPGQAVSGPGIQAGTTVVSATNGLFSLNQSGNTILNSNFIGGLATTAGIQYGMGITGPAIPTGAYVTAIIDGTSINMSVNADETTTASAIDISGGGTITLSLPALATTSGVPLTITGGTLAAPLWGAGNTNSNPLFTVPTCVGQFNSRAYYAVENYLVYSDASNPTQVTNASQALTMGDSTPVTALAGLPYTNTVTGGVVAALIAFKGAETLFQISGDPDSTTAPLSQDQINGAVGTLAPNTICATPLGLAYMATDGLRILSLTGQVSDPIGTDGSGVSVPFLNAVNPSRMCAAFGQNVLRISVQNGAAIGEPQEEYWFDFKQKIWTGPHTFPAALIESYPTAGAAGGFIMAPVSVKGLYQSGVIPVTTSTYVENGAQLNWTYRTTLGPDNQGMANNQTVQSTLALALSPTDTVRVRGLNEVGRSLDTAYLTGITVRIAKYNQAKYGRANYGSSSTTAVWGAVSWGAFSWGAQVGPFVQYRIPWDGPLVFKQMQFEVTGVSAPGQTIGNLYMTYQETGYVTEGAGA